MATRETGGYFTADADGSQLRLIHAILSPAIVATITTAEQTFTVPEVLAADVAVSVQKPTNNAGVMVGQARVSAANQLGITFVNPTAAGVTPTASQEYIFGIASDRGL